jgi:hypothetical protein
MADIDFKGKDWNSQIKFGQPGFYGESNTADALATRQQPFSC